MQIVVADISKFEMEGSYDRILSIEMFEACLTVDYLLTRKYHCSGFDKIYYCCSAAHEELWRSSEENIELDET